ncbi:MAG: response regulator [Desulfobacterales bacterium]|nr:response regulator [Desulfobacterales bacterium]MBF0398156.1 response regulator [Desulfobacterales bacterium]
MTKDQNQHTLLVVDDEVHFLNLITRFLENTDYRIETASNGQKALEMLYNNIGKYTAILMDRVMPDMDGIEVLKIIKKHESLKYIPVILQTGLKTEENIIEGYQAGAFCYLPKPYNSEMLLTMINTALIESNQMRFLLDENKETIETLKLMDRGFFKFRTIAEGRNLVKLMSKACPNCLTLEMGLIELVINAVEHGNLAISYDEKGELLIQSKWLEEIERRLIDPKYSSKFATLLFERTDDKISFLIKDQGLGFDWQQYMQFSEERIYDIHGRGIAMANNTTFDKIEYIGSGNEVLAVILNKKE